MRHYFTATAVIALAFALPAMAQSAGEHDAHHPAQAQAPASDALADGEVRKVDKDAGNITLRHGPIASLGMPSMMMVFRTKDPATLDQVKPGDKVRFSAEQIGGQLTVTRIERTQ
jgi:Cu(I)/Ag(I) efflux system protein CusF